MNNNDILTPWEYKKYLLKINKKLNEKSEDQSYDYGCVMGFFDFDTKDLYKNYFTIDEDDIYNNEENEYGLEIEPHVTLLYGLHEDVNEDLVIDILKLFKTIDVTFENISLFENEKYDVLKFDVDTETLATINTLLKDTFDHTETFPDYHPHVTLAYLKPGTGKKYITEIEDIITKPIDYFVYSMANGKKIAVHENSEEEIIKLERTNDTIKENNNVINYKECFIHVEKCNRFKDGYKFSVSKDNNYLFGFKNSTTYNLGLKEIKEAIDSKFGKEKRNK